MIAAQRLSTFWEQSCTCATPISLSPPYISDGTTESGMSEKSKLTRCDVCEEMVDPEKAIYDKGVNYPEIAKKKLQQDRGPGEDPDTVTICQECNKKLVDKDVPNA